MRLRPTTTWVTREALEDIPFKDVLIKKGTTLHLFTELAGTDPARARAGNRHHGGAQAPLRFRGRPAPLSRPHHRARRHDGSVPPACRSASRTRSTTAQPTWLPDSGNTGPITLPIKFDVYMAGLKEAGGGRAASPFKFLNFVERGSSSVAAGHRDRPPDVGDLVLALALRAGIARGLGRASGGLGAAAVVVVPAAGFVLAAGAGVTGADAVTSAVAAETAPLVFADVLATSAAEPVAAPVVTGAATGVALVTAGLAPAVVSVAGAAAVVSPHRAISSGARFQVNVLLKNLEPALPTTRSLSSLSRVSSTSYFRLRSGL